MPEEAKTKSNSIFDIVKVVLIIAVCLSVGILAAFHPGSQAQRYMRQGRYKAALAQFEQPFDNPLYLSDPFLYLDYSICLKRLSDYNASLSKLDKADKVFAKHPLYSKFLSILYFKSFQHDLNIEKGWNLYHLKDYEGAASAFKKALKINNSSAIAYSGLAEVYYEQGDHEASEKTYQKGIDISQGQEKEKILHERGKNRRDQGKVDEAIQDLTDAINSYSCAFASYDRALLYMRQNKLNEALSDLDTAIGITPREKFYHERALLRKRMNDLKGALQDIKRAEALNESCETLSKDKEEIKKLLSKSA